jgi:hypothetical protein
MAALASSLHWPFPELLDPPLEFLATNEVTALWASDKEGISVYAISQAAEILDESLMI